VAVGVLGDGEAGVALDGDEERGKRALDSEVIDANPMAALPLPPEYAGPVPVSSSVSFGEGQAPLAVLEPVDAVVWFCAFFAGLRMGEIRALQRRDVAVLQKIHVRGG
jgi:hypothetical protein